MYVNRFSEHIAEEKPRQSASQKRGFTIVELLVVVVVIGILASISVTGYSGIQQRATWTRAQAEVRSVSTTMETYYIDKGTYPITYAEFKVPVQMAGLWEPGRDTVRSYVYCGDASIYYLVPHPSISLVSGTTSAGGQIKRFSSTQGWGQFTYSPTAFPGGGNFQQNTCAVIMPDATLRLWMHDSVLMSV